MTTSHNPAVPPDVILELHNLRYTHCMRLENASTFIRRSLVPDGYEPYPLKRDTPETLLDKLRWQHGNICLSTFHPEAATTGSDLTKHL